MKRLLTCVVLTFALYSLASAQDIRPVSGGTGNEPDPKDKKLIRLVAADNNKKLTLGRSMMRHKSARMIGIYIKIENLTDAPLTVQTSKFSMTDDGGKGYYGLETEEAIKRFTATHGIATAVMAGPLMNPAVQARMGEEIRRESLESGDIPPHSFKEGVVFFDAPKQQHYTLKGKLTGRWPDDFIFTTEKDKK